MKILVVTVYDSIVNYGSFLQAYSLQEVLTQMGHEVFFLRRMNDSAIIDRFNNLSRIQHQVPKTRKLWRLHQMRQNSIIRMEQAANNKRYECFRQDWELFRLVNYGDICSYSFDVVICGSDEIWNLHNMDIDFLFYSCLQFSGIPKIAYAISSGDTRFDEIRVVENGLEAIGDFDILLPRDQMTKELIDTVTGLDTMQVCDPTILLGRDNYQITNYGQGYGKYILVYSYVFRTKEQEFIRRYAKEHCLKIVSPCIYAHFADENVQVGSLDFPSLIANAECVFTTTYHGTIFSLMFAKKLCCLPRLPKVQYLLEECNAEKHILLEECGYDNFCCVLANEVHHDAIDKKMAEIRRVSKEVLETALCQVSDHRHHPIGVHFKDMDSYYYGYSLDADNVRRKSSSGGLFYEIAKHTLDNDGVVFGAYYDNTSHTVRHGSTRSTPLERLMRSKYVESNLGDTFLRIEDELKQGHEVVFCGTPCQAAGLRNYVNLKLEKYEEQLIIIDFMCEGVPSQTVFQDYIKQMEGDKRKIIKEVVFRSKKYGWNCYCMHILFEDGTEVVHPSFVDPYMHTFIMDLVMNRNSCYRCKFREHKKSDITIGDFWQAKSIDEKCKDNKGVSVLFVHTEKGKKILEAISDRLYLVEGKSEIIPLMKQNLELSKNYPDRESFYNDYCKRGFGFAIQHHSSYMGNMRRIQKIKYKIRWYKLEHNRRKVNVEGGAMY